MAGLCSTELQWSQPQTRPTATRSPSCPAGLYLQYARRLPTAVPGAAAAVRQLPGPVPRPRPRGSLRLHAEGRTAGGGERPRAALQWTPRASGDTHATRQQQPHATCAGRLATATATTRSTKWHSDTARPCLLCQRRHASIRLRVHLADTLPLCRLAPVLAQECCPLCGLEAVPPAPPLAPPRLGGSTAPPLGPTDASLAPPPSPSPRAPKRSRRPKAATSPSPPPADQGSPSPAVDLLSPSPPSPGQDPGVDEPQQPENPSPPPQPPEDISASPLPPASASPPPPMPLISSQDPPSGVELFSPPPPEVDSSPPPPPPPTGTAAPSPPPPLTPLAPPGACRSECGAYPWRLQVGHNGCLNLPANINWG